MRLGIIGTLALIGMLASTARLRAHHSFSAEYDAKAMITLTGKVNSVEWSNPHISIHLDVTDAAGKVTRWAVEGYPPNTLSRNGFARENLKQGDTVTITAFRAKNGSNTASGHEVIFSDGTKKLVGGQTEFFKR